MSDAGHAERLARDKANRLRALDPRESFLVQAPAGSGKTELLIQRYLALLARVDAPHRVVAMTFTRKAASEMRERVIGALRDGRDDVPIESDHQRATRALAKAVLVHGDALGWSLLEHPAALAIFTIDALSGTLARQAPITSRLGAAPRVIERAEALYAEAARNSLTEADPADERWRVLLAHLDNNAQQVVALIAAMLAKREQWLPHVVGKDSDKLRAQIESVLRAEIDAELSAAHAAFDTPTLNALARCAGQAAEYLRADDAKARSRVRSSAALPVAACPRRITTTLPRGRKWPTGFSSARSRSRARRWTSAPACRPRMWTVGASRPKSRPCSMRSPTGRSCSVHCIARATSRLPASPTRTGRR
jgi:ATP-dependent exoDNAse (exonuclease V) beta subunit